MRKPENVRILVVDDEADVREYLASVLEDAGMQVETVADGDAALRILESDPPDLISLDLVMPGKSGIRFMHELRKHPDRSRIPVVIVSGHARDTDIREDLDAVLADRTLSSPTSVLEKPVTPHGYLENICRILEVAVPDTVGEAARDNLQREASDLLRGADQALLEEIVARLKSGQKDG